MKKILLTGLLLATISYTAMCQWVHSSRDEMTSLNWGIIGMINFKQVNDTLVYPVYNEDVKRFENRRFQLTGYMIPTKAGMKQTKFMIST